MSKKTTALTVFIIVLWLSALIWNFISPATQAFAYTAVVFAIGFVSFVGFLNISRALRGAVDTFQDGDVRFALTCSFLAVFLALLSFYSFTTDEPTQFARSIIDSFLTLTIVVVGFYFATSGTIELFKIWGRGREPARQQEPKRTSDAPT